VPGLAAKPVLDLLAPVRELHAAPDDVLEQLGYTAGEHRPHEARWFWKSEDRRTHQLHLTVRASALWQERLAFRDALLRSSELRATYQALKLSLVDDVETYTDNKRPFVAEVLAQQGISL
jgi:GrpB-like predicted nucleotidyltransferase (UPF0157 family)